MKIYHLLFFAAITSLSSCMWGVPNKPKADITTDTLAYSYKTIKEGGTGWAINPDSGCTVLKIKYPGFKDQQRLEGPNTCKRDVVLLAPVKDTSLQQLTTDF